MKKRMTLFVSFLAIVFALLSQSPVKADTTINFSELSYTLDNYSESEVAVSYNTVGFTEIATITDKNSGEILEEISFTPDLTRGPIAHMNLTRDTYIGRHLIRLVVNVVVERFGSFRQINAVNSYYLTLIDPVSNVSIEHQQINLWPTSSPTTTLSYNATGTLVATIDYSVGISAGLEGFQFSSNAGDTYYYRRYFNFSGSIHI